MNNTYNNLKQNLPNFVERDAQLKMISTITGSITNGEIACVEGPCGTGKSFGYLVSVIPLALQMKKVVVISTATVALQEQILNHDLPLLLNYGDIQFEYAMAKGRSRYLCLERFSHALQDSATIDAIDQDDETWSLTDIKAELDNGWDGDMDSLNGAIDKQLWRRIRCDAHHCAKKQCLHYDNCPLFLARKKLNDANVIIANHDMVFSDIKRQGGGTILPDVDKTIYVFDEAHHLPQKARGQFTFEFKIKEVVPTLISLLQLLKNYVCRDEGYKQYVESIKTIAQACTARIQRMDDSLHAVKPGTFQDCNGRRVWRFEHGVLPSNLAKAISALVTDFNNLDSACTNLINHLRDNVKCGPDEYDDYMDFFGNAMKRFGAIQRICYTLKTFNTEHENRAVPRARWIEYLLDTEDCDYRFVTSPIDVSRHLFRYIWDKCAGAVVTSATLTSFGIFDNFARSTGLHNLDNVNYLKLEPHFDYQRQATLIVPHMAFDPKQPDDHTSEIIDNLPDLVCAGVGNLVLFASRMQMQAVYDRLPDGIRSSILMQGNMPKLALLERHKQIVTDGNTSIIFGLATLAEGIDLPGKLCERVIIAKIPFSVPITPQEVAINEWMVALGLDPFREVTLHETIIKLNQQVGRLIRTITDQGIVIILDKRLLTKPYGKPILDSLPNFNRLCGVAFKDIFSNIMPFAA